jgi:hypothetical protein
MQTIDIVGHIPASARERLCRHQKEEIDKYGGGYLPARRSRARGRAYQVARIADLTARVERSSSIRSQSPGDSSDHVGEK